MRQIGEEFEAAFAPMRFATGADGACFGVCRYRVRAHDEGREVLDPIAYRHVEPLCWALVAGEWTAVPPPELDALCPPSWRRLRALVPEGFTKQPGVTTFLT